MNYEGILEQLAKNGFANMAAKLNPRVGDALQVFDDLTHGEQLRVIYGDQSSEELREILEDIIESESVDIEDLLNYIEERK